MNVELSAFVEHARAKGMDHATIRLMLVSAGWKERDVIEALARTSLDLPVPAPPDTGGAREAFLHLSTFAAFYTAVIAVVTLLFHYIDRVWPDAAITEHPERWRLSQIRWSMAYTLVSFPAFLWLSRLLLGEMRRHPERSWSATRRWLTYLTLLLASIALGVDFVTLVFNLLEGELTARFVLKVLVVLVVSVATLAYYSLSLRLPVDRPATGRVHRAFATAASGLVGLVLLWGFVLSGTPGTARLHRFDDRRIDDLAAIRDEIHHLCLGDQRHQPDAERRLLRPLPATLDELAAAARRRRPPVRDPESGAPYDYEVLDERRFRLCATFSHSRDEEDAPVWNHRPGRQCFEFDALEP